MDERRASPRTTVSLQAMLRYPGGARARACRIRDLSLNGAFLEAPATEVPTGFDAGVEIGLSVILEGEPKRHHIAATICRLAPDGVGVAFGDFAMDAYVSLSRLLSSP